jgi:hypothetical protein
MAEVDSLSADDARSHAATIAGRWARHPARAVVMPSQRCEHYAVAIFVLLDQRLRMWTSNISPDVI